MYARGTHFIFWKLAETGVFNTFSDLNFFGLEFTFPNIKKKSVALNIVILFPCSLLFNTCTDTIYTTTQDNHLCNIVPLPGHSSFISHEVVGHVVSSFLGIFRPISLAAPVHVQHVSFLPPCPRND